MLQKTRDFIAGLFKDKPAFRYYDNNKKTSIPANGQLWPGDKIVEDLSDPHTMAPGMELYKDVNGNLARRWNRNTAGVPTVAIVDMAAGGTDQGQVLPYLFMANLAGLPTVAANLQTNYARAPQLQRRIGVATATLVGGVLDNIVVQPAVAGYYGVVRLLAVVSDTGGTYTLTHQDEDDVAVNGPLAGVIDAVIPDARRHVDMGPGLVYYGTADNKAIEVDISAGAGGEVVSAIYERWYET